VVAVVVLVVVLGVAAAVVVLRVVGLGQGSGSVLLLGDSITYGVEPTARERLGGRYSLSVEGIPGVEAPQEIAAAQSASQFPFDQVVVNLGTNDVSDPEQDLNETAAALDQIVSSFATVDCVHLVTINERMLTDGSSGPRAQQLNEVIRQIASRHDNAHIIDWAKTVHQSAADDENITSDTVHPNERGNELLADEYGQALDSCST
jgi:lysophospholipase L1-like esterase